MGRPRKPPAHSNGKANGHGNEHANGFDLGEEPTEEQQHVSFSLATLHKLGLLECARLPPGATEPFFTDNQRERVRELAQWGVPQRRICLHVINPLTGRPVSEDMLKKYFQAELDQGRAIGDGDLMHVAHMMAVGSPAQFDSAGRKVREEIPPDGKMLRALLFLRLNLKSAYATENPDSDKTSEREEFERRLEQLPDDVIEQIRALLAHPVAEQAGALKAYR